MTERQEQFYRLYLDGCSMNQIAKRYKLNRSTVSRTIARAEKHLREAGKMAQFAPDRRDDDPD